MANDAPDHVIEAERVLWDWGTRDPRDRVSYMTDEGAGENARGFLNDDIQYHLGAYTAAASVCNALYSIEGLDRAAPAGPPWETAAFKELRRLEGGVLAGTD